MDIIDAALRQRYANLAKPLNTANIPDLVNALTRSVLQAQERPIQTLTETDMYYLRSLVKDLKEIVPEL